MDDVLRAARQLLLFFPLGLVALVLAAVAVGWVRSKRGTAAKRAYTSSALDVIVMASLLGPLLLTLAPSADQTRSIEWIPFEQLDGGGIRVVAEMAGNVILFIPVGLVVPARWIAMRSLGRVTLAGGLFSLSIETLQFALGLGRQPSATDVVTNTVGTVVGYVVFTLLRRVFQAAGSAR